MRVLKRLLLVIAASLTAIGGPLASVSTAADFSVRINQARYIDVYTVEVSGVVTCPTMSGYDEVLGYFGDVLLTEVTRPDRLLATGSGYADGKCTGGAEPFSATISNSSGIAFARGRALLTGTFYTYGCNYDEEGGECFPIDEVSIHQWISVH